MLGAHYCMSRPSSECNCNGPIAHILRCVNGSSLITSCIVADCGLVRHLWFHTLNTRYSVNRWLSYVSIEFFSSCKVLPIHSRAVIGLYVETSQVNVPVWYWQIDQNVCSLCMQSKYVLEPVFIYSNSVVLSPK
jgi:hypothetical protein